LCQLGEFPKKFISRGLAEVLPPKRFAYQAFLSMEKGTECNRKPAPPTPDSTDNVVIIEK